MILVFLVSMVATSCSKDENTAPKMTLNVSIENTTNDTVTVDVRYAGDDTTLRVQYSYFTYGSIEIAPNETYNGALTITKPSEGSTAFFLFSSEGYNIAYYETADSVGVVTPEYNYTMKSLVDHCEFMVIYSDQPTF